MYKHVDDVRNSFNETRSYETNKLCKGIKVNSLGFWPIPVFFSGTSLHVCHLVFRAVIASAFQSTCTLRKLQHLEDFLVGNLHSQRPKVSKPKSSCHPN